MTVGPMNEQEIFAAAIKLPKSERAEFVAQKCLGDTELRAQILELLCEHDQSGGPLPKIMPRDEEATQGFANMLAAGSLIAGRFKLLEAIGEGGMGSVWVVEQTTPVKRKVAIKLVKAGMDSRQVLARFDAERQALALMDHPNIAKIFDGGVTHQGRPFFVMEYVKGMPLNEYCDQAKLSVRQRLNLFIPICQAVQHAHQKGIIHRDLKPSNVLVCLYDGKPVPKVIDFGLAKAMHQPLTDKTIYTSHGLMIGTPLYMSPEQAEQNNLDVDTRTDIYSLGVILYELLTGSTPLEKAQFKEAAFQEVLRLIKEVEPPKPSTRVSGSHTLPAIAAQRSLEPEALSREIRGDLDWIVMKALDKDRGRRYETANGLAREIERYLNDEAVEACPPSAAYRLSKLYRKNRTAILTASAFVLILTAGTIVSSLLAWRATVAEGAIKEERDRALLSRQTAIKAEAAASQARDDERLARAAESEQRALAEQQRDEAQRLSQEAKDRSLQLEKLTESQRRTIYASEMTLVRLEAQRGNLQRVREILMKQLPVDGDEDFRGFEWNYWYRFLQQAKLIRSIDSFRFGVNSAAGVILPYARVAAIGQKDSTQLIEIETGKLLTTIPLSMKTLVDRTPFSENGRSVYGNYASLPFRQDQSIVQGESLVVVDPKGRKLEFTYPQDSFQHVHALNLSPDGRFVGALGNDLSHTQQDPACRLLVWNIESGKLILNRLMRRELNRFEFNRNGQLVAAYVCHGSKRFEDTLREVLTVIQVDKNEEIAAVQYNDDIDRVTWLPDSNRLILSSLGFSGKGQKELLAWDMGASALSVLSAERMPDYVHTALDPRGRVLAVGGHGSPTVRLIDTQDGRLLQSLHNQATTIVSMAFSHDGTQLTALGTQGEILRWQLNEQHDQFALRSHPIRLKYSRSSELKWAMAKNLERVAVGSYMGELLVRDRKGNESFRRDAGQSTAEVLVLAISDSGKYLAVARNSGGRSQIEMVDVDLGETLWNEELTDSRERVMSNSELGFTKNEESIVIGCSGKLVMLGTKDGKRIEYTKSDRVGFANAAHFVRSPVNNQLFVAGLGLDYANAPLEIRDATTNEALASMSSEWIGSKKEALAKKFLASPDALRCAVFSESSTEIWDLKKSKLLLKTSATSGEFSQDGQRFLALETEKRTNEIRVIAPQNRITRLKIFDVEAGRELATISFAGDYADLVKFSPDATRLLTLHGSHQRTGDDSRAHGKLWDTSTGLEILDLPIADTNNNHWTLSFDNSGQQLLGLLFCNSNGSGGRGSSVQFDGTPLPPAVDRALIAGEIVEKHYRRTLVPEAVIEKILQNPKLPIAVRDEALAQARRLTLDIEQVVSVCRDIAIGPEQTKERFEEALRMAEAVQAASPKALRGLVLKSAVLLRLQRWDEALAVAAQLRVLKENSVTPNHTENPNLEYEQLWRATEVRCYFNKGEAVWAHRRAIELVDWIHATFNDSSSRTPVQMWPTFVRDALATQGPHFQSLQVQSRVPPRPTPAPAEKRINQIKSAFMLTDRNHDQLITMAEVDNGYWQRLKDFDANGDDALDLEDYAVFGHQVALEQVLNRSDRQAQWERQFELNDQDGDNAYDGYTPDRKGLRDFDADGDGRISRTEYVALQQRQAYIQSMFQLKQLLEGMYGAELRIYNIGLKKFPDEVNLLNARAFLQATCPDDKIRNGAQAVEDATKACEYFDWKNPSWIDTLASAYAEIGRFDEAVKFQKLTLSLSGEERETRVYKERLALYEAGKPYREIISESEIYNQADPTSIPMLSSEVVAKSRRLTGGEPCWSPDGKELLYALTGFSPSASYLEKIDLATGAVQFLGTGGQSIVWTDTHGGTIAMERKDTSIPVSKTSAGFSEIWLIGSNGENERKLFRGAKPSWSQDGKLWALKVDRSPEIVSVDIENPQENLFAIECRSPMAIVSPDGKKVAYSAWGKWKIEELQALSKIETRVSSEADFGHAEWSPNGRWIAFGAASLSKPGIWLINGETLERKLLADISAMPRWSPDGKTIAAGLHTSNEIVLLDVSQLEL